MKRRLLITTVVLLVLGTSVALAAPASNDDIADAIDLVEAVEQRFITIDATLEATEVVCGGLSAESVWFSFTAPAAANYAAYATGSDHDTEVGWSSDLATTSGTCPDDSDDSYDALEVTPALANGEQEYVHMAVDQAGYTGAGSVGVARIQAASDDFANALDLSMRSEDASSAVLGVAFDSIFTSESGESTVCGLTSL
jgi:hypothetical protein